MARYQKKRILERAGFVHVSGWVRKEDAPRIREAIRRGEADALDVLDSDRHDATDRPGAALSAFDKDVPK